MRMILPGTASASSADGCGPSSATDLRIRRGTPRRRRRGPDCGLPSRSGSASTRPDTCSPVRAISAPPSNHGACDVRSANTSTPTPLPTRPARVPAVAEVHDDDVVGRAGQDPDRHVERCGPDSVISSTSGRRCRTRNTGMPCASAVFGLMYATLSHVTFDSGFGSSCSQPLLAKRPSRTCGSGRKTISMPGLAADRRGAGAVPRPAPARSRLARAAEASTCRATNPSCSALRQNESAFANGWPLRFAQRRASAAERRRPVAP